MKRDQCKYGILRGLGICANCKKEQSIPGKPYCPKCDEKIKARRKEEREWYKKNGICSLCHKNKAAPDKTLCFDCADKVRERIQKARDNWTPEEKQHFKELGKQADKKRSELRISQGLCVKCGKHKLSARSIRMCDFCLAKHRERQRQIRLKKLDEQGIFTQAERKSRGLCMWCSKPFKPNGTAFCDDCRERARQNSLKIDKTNWKAWNRKQNNVIFAKKGDKECQNK